MLLAVPQNQTDNKATDPSLLASETGDVIYAFQLNTGLKVIPSGSELNISADPQGVTFGPCMNSSGGIIPLSTSTTEEILPGHIDCKVTVHVNSVHKALGQIPGFSVRAVITSANGTTSEEFYVPVVQTLDVPVYTGGHLGLVYSTVLTTAASSEYLAGRSA